MEKEVEQSEAAGCPPPFREINGVQHFIPVEERLTKLELCFYYWGMIEWKREQMSAMYIRRDGRRSRQAEAFVRNDQDTVQVLQNAIESDNDTIDSLASELMRLQKELSKYPLPEFPYDK